MIKYTGSVNTSDGMKETERKNIMFKIALCQKNGSQKKTTEECKAENNVKAENMIKEAVAGGAQIVVLPEIWNAPYSNRAFEPFSEDEDGPTVKLMSSWASKYDIYLVGGSIPEKGKDGKLYNTCFVFDRKGNKIAKHRKAHMFDINIPGKMRFMESDVLTPGDSMTTFDTEYGKMGVAICFDVRFPEFIRKEALDGAQLVFLPASFNMTTGPAHWDLTIRARALDNQIFFAACAPARNEKSSYLSYSNSCVADPWGTFIAHADEKEQILYCDIDLDRVGKIRSQLPLIDAMRPELY